MTHAAGSAVNMEMLAKLSESLNVKKNILDEIRLAPTARRVMELAQEHNFLEITDLICKKVVSVCSEYIEKNY